MVKGMFRIEKNDGILENGEARGGFYYFGNRRTLPLLDSVSG